MIDEKKLIEAMWGKWNSFYNVALRFEKEETEMATRVLKDIQSMIDEQPKVGEWIPCSVDAPDDNQIVVVSTIDGGIHIATFHIAKWKNYCWYSFETGGMFTSPYVTAWLPLPEPYKEEK